MKSENFNGYCCRKISFINSFFKVFIDFKCMYVEHSSKCQKNRTMLNSHGNVLCTYILNRTRILIYIEKGRTTHLTSITDLEEFGEASCILNGQCKMPYANAILLFCSRIFVSFFPFKVSNWARNALLNFPYLNNRPKCQ